MKYLSVISFALLLALGCNNEFNLLADREEIPIIYGFISMSDTAQYVRVERAFRDNEISAFDLAQLPDSLYYADARVSITHVESNTEYTMQKVDGDAEGYPREDGVFATVPNILYKLKSEDITLVEGDTYRVTVHDANEDVLASATTILTDIPRLTNPREGIDYSFKYDGLSLIDWLERDDIAIYDVNFHFNYRERDNSSAENDFVDKTITWNIANNLEEGDNGSRYQYDGVEFYSFMLGALEQSEFLDRRFVNFDAELIGGGQELKEYINVIQANSGITSSGEIPIYTNVENGYGVFSSRSTDYVSDLVVATKTLDSLVNSQLTAPLNFDF